MFISFSNIKKSIFTNLKKPRSIFCLSSFSNIKKLYLQILKNLAQFFAYPLFQILKKVYLQILKTWPNFLLTPLFQISKKVYLQISKYPFHTSNNFKETIYIKTIIQIIIIKTIMSTKQKYAIIACIPKLL